MPGIVNATNVTLENITNMLNISSPEQFFISVNQVIYGGWLWFVLLGILFIILFVSAQQVKDQILNNLMFASASCTILSFLLRGIYIVTGGIRYGLLTDHQLWIFPIVTLILVITLWIVKD